MTEPIPHTLDGALAEVEGLLSAADYTPAIARCTELLSAYPDAVRVLRARGRAAELAGEWAHAIDDYTRVTDIVPLDACALIGLARCQAATGETTAAVITAQQALDIDPTNADALKIASAAPDVLKNRGRIAAPRGMYTAGLTTRALSQLKRFMQDNPDRVDAQIVLMELTWRDGSRIATAEQCQAILDTQPDCLNAHALLSVLWAQMNNPALAQLHGREMERFDPDYRELYAWLGDQSPFAVRDAPLQPPPPEPELIMVNAGEQVTVEDEDSERDRLAFVQELIAASGPVTSLASDALPAQDQLAQPAEPQPELEQFTGDITSTSPLEWLPVDTGDEQEATLPDWIVSLQKQAAVTATMGDADDELSYAAPRAESRSNQSAAYEWTPGSGDEPHPVTLAQRKAVDAPEGTGSSELPSPATESAPVARPVQPAKATAKRKTIDAKAVEASVPASPAAESAPVAPPVQPAKVSAPKLRSKLKSQKTKATHDEKLIAAHKAIEAGRYDEAADHYAALIKSGKKLDLVLADLDVATHAYPDVRRFHALLGDAYARKGDVNAALIAYHRALEIQ